MNELTKFALSLAGSVGILAFLWSQLLSHLKLKRDTYLQLNPNVLPTTQPEYSFSSGVFVAWFLTSVLALTLLLGTFEYRRRNLIRLAGVSLLLINLLIGIGVTKDSIDTYDALVLLNRWGELGIICVGAGLLILIGGIDLSAGSMVALAAVGFCVLMEIGLHPYLALAVVLLGGFACGAVQGLLVTQLRLQAFLVTLCGMFVFRGVARSIGKGEKGINGLKQGFEDSPSSIEALLNLRFWLTGQDPLTERLVFPAQMVVFLLLASLLALFLHRSAFGRFWKAIGYNEQAARYAGVNTWRHKVFVFGVASSLAAFAGSILFLSSGSVQGSSAGTSYELYAITAVVLGGISLRGGEGTAVGLVLGAMVEPFLRRFMTATTTPDEWIPWLIGLILLFGTIVDELIQRRSKAGK